MSSAPAGRAFRRGLAAAVGAAALYLFVAFGSVTVYEQREGYNVAVAGHRRVLDVWQVLGDNLPSVFHSTALGLAFDLCIAVLLVTSAAGLWLAMAADEPPESTAGVPSLSSNPPAPSPLEPPAPPE